MKTILFLQFAFLLFFIIQKKNIIRYFYFYDEKTIKNSNVELEFNKDYKNDKSEEITVKDFIQDLQLIFDNCQNFIIFNIEINRLKTKSMPFELINQILKENGEDILNQGAKIEVLNKKKLQIMIKRRTKI